PLALLDALPLCTWPALRCRVLGCGAPSRDDGRPLSLHDALPISTPNRLHSAPRSCGSTCSSSGSDGSSGSILHCLLPPGCPSYRDRKSTRLNSSHVSISYAVFCLKKQKVAAGGRRDRKSTRRQSS